MTTRISVRLDRRTATALAALEKGRPGIPRTRTWVISQAILEMFTNHRDALELTPEQRAQVDSRFPLAKKGARS